MNIFLVEPPPFLEERIAARISLAEKKSIRNKTFLFGFGASLSLAAVIYTAISLFQSFVQTGFFEYFSLIFSGDSAVLTLWKEITYSLAESLPVFGIIGFLVASGFLIWLSANTFTSARKFVWVQ